MRSLAELWRGMLLRPEAEFLVGPDGVMTYRELVGQVRRWLAAFDRRGLRSGDRVLLLSQHEPSAISAFIACLLDGLVPVLLARDSAEERVNAIHDLVSPALVVTDVARRGERWSDNSLPTFGDATSVSTPAAPRAGSDVAVMRSTPLLPDDGDALAYLMFTSGTTQAPSGVMISRRSILANLHTLSRVFGYDRESRIFNDMILAHADGLVQGPLLAVVNGCTLIRQGGFTLPGLESWLEAVRATRATHVITVPTIWSMIDRYAGRDDYFQAAECRALLSVAARLEPELWRRLEPRFGRPVLNQYGLTETVTSACYAGRAPEMGCFGTIGRPIDCEARITPEAQGQVGELQLRGENVFMGYWQNPERTAQTFTPDGWMRTGDVAEALPDGSYQILGRLKTVIMSGGFLIRPEEVDEALRSHAAVIEVATIGMPDPQFEEVPVSAVVLERPVSEAELTEHCRARLEALKVPKRIIPVEAIPRGAAGKPQLQALRAIVAAHREVEALRPDRDWLGDVISLAADIFREDPGRLTPAMGQSDIAGWDSFSQLNLVFAAEERFGVRIPASKVVAFRTLDDLATILRTL